MANLWSDFWGNPKYQFEQDWVLSNPLVALEYKNLDRWCRGILGKEHTPSVAMPNTAVKLNLSCGWNHGVYECHHLLKCEKCRKFLKRYVARSDCPTYTERYDHADS